MTRVVVYHSYEWSCLVEQDWITMHVEQGKATMLFQPPRNRFWF